MSFAPNKTETLKNKTLDNTCILPDIIRKAQNEILNLNRNVSTVNAVGGLAFDGKDSGTDDQTYSALFMEIIDNTSGAEIGRFHIYNVIAGTLKRVATFTHEGNLRIGATDQRLGLIEAGLSDYREFNFPDESCKVVGNGPEDVTLGDGKDFALGSSAGTKIGTATTQKLGFFNAAPIQQKAANADTSGATLPQLETEVNELKQILRDYGLLAT